MNENNVKKKVFPFSIFPGILAIVLVVVSVFVAVSEPFLEMPVAELMFGKGEINKLKDTLEDAAEDLDERVEAALEEDADDIEDFEKNIGMPVEDFVEIVKNPSLNDVIHVIDVIEKNPGYEDMVDLSEGEEYMDMVPMLRWAIFGYAALVAIIMLLATIFRKFVITIIALVLALPFLIMIMNWIYPVAFLILGVVHILLAIREKKAKRVLN